MIPNTSQLIDRFRELQSRLQELEALRGQHLIDAIFPEEDWAADLREYAQADEQTDCDAPGLLERLKTKIIQPELPTDVQYVRVMSLHKSKGLTADMVIVLGCIAGMIPSVIPQDAGPSEQQRFIEEQRRLFFVAITRTRHTLVLSSVSSLPRDMAYRMRVPVAGGAGAYARTRASMFIADLGPSAPRPTDGQSFLAAAPT
jgi:DNA helicase-2/ATP-dependent DNA helicase PcrA